MRIPFFLRAFNRIRQVLCCNCAKQEAADRSTMQFPVKQKDPGIWFSPDCQGLAFCLTLIGVPFHPQHPRSEQLHILLLMCHDQKCSPCPELQDLLNCPLFRLLIQPRQHAAAYRRLKAPFFSAMPPARSDSVIPPAAYSKGRACLRQSGYCQAHLHSRAADFPEIPR